MTAWLRDIGIALSPMILLPLGQWACTFRFGTALLFLTQTATMVGCFAFPILFPLKVYHAVFGKERSIAAGEAGLLLLFFGSVIVGIVLAHPVRQRLMMRIEVAGEPLIQAIRKFELTNGTPPVALKDLVPEYLSEIPSTGLKGYPNFVYLKNTEDKPSFVGNSWMLWVTTSSGLMNFDRMVYLPNENYPSRDDGGRYQRMGTWAYYHE